MQLLASKFWEFVFCFAGEKLRTKINLVTGFLTYEGSVICVQVWNKVLKAASKHFKKKKRDPMDHVRLSNYLRDGNI